jgi:predicted dehydrogenase
MLNIGIIGVGGIAKAHMPGWIDGDRTTVVAGADLDEAALTAWGDQHDVARRYADAMQLIADDDIDVVDICVPNRFHAPLAIAALEAGKHVLCEKPLAPTVDEVKQIIAARDKAGKLVMTAQHFRYEKAALALKTEADAGALGEVYYGRAQWLRRGQVPNGPGFLDKEKSGGGPCIDIGVHVLDLALHLMGQPTPTSVTGISVTKLMNKPGAFSMWGLENLPHVEHSVEDFAAGMIRFANGAALSLEASWMLHHQQDDGRNETMKLSLYGDKAGAVWPEARLHWTDNDKKRLYDVKLGALDDRIPPHARECMAFADAIENNEPSPVPPEESLNLIAILDGLYTSAQTGHEVKLAL